MAGAAMDHIISLIVFMAAMLLFIGIFNQSMSTAVIYEAHTSSAVKTSDLLDAILLNPGLPVNWGQSDGTVTVFGLQNPELSQYKLSPFSLMRLSSTMQAPVTYGGAYYNNLTAGFGSQLLTPISYDGVESVDYARASRLLGVNGTYGFQLTLTPTATVTIEKTSAGAPLEFSVNVAGTGSQLAYAAVSYSLLLVNPNGEYPSFTLFSDTKNASKTGTLELTFPEIDGESESYALLVYARLYGLKGMGYYVHDCGSSKSVIPLVSSFENRAIIVAHSDALEETPTPPLNSPLSYNASYFILTEEYTLRSVVLGDPESAGTVVYDSEVSPDFPSITVPSDEGLLAVVYRGVSAQDCGVVLMPWGLSALAFPVTFGESPRGQDWVTTDIRQVIIGDISYQAKLALWRLNGVTA